LILYFFCLAAPLLPLLPVRNGWQFQSKSQKIPDVSYLWFSAQNGQKRASFAQGFVVICGDSAAM
jgi:hypothetical protein